MNSGIYKLTFKSGHYYIGKSADITSRWRQHQDKLCKGMGSVKLQIEFNKYNDYTKEVLFRCHPDHLDIMETYCLNKLDKSKMLNTSFPAPLSDDEYAPILANLNLLQYSTSTLIKTLVQQATTLKLMSGY
jgi:hypothetical protein